MTTPSHPGPIFDTAMRRLVENDPASVCRLLQLPVTGSARVLSATLPTGTFSADLILELAPGELAQVEYMREVSADLVARMLIYRGLIMRENPRARIWQHIIVLGEGRRLQGFDDLDQHGFALDLGVHYLCDLDPGAMLQDPGLAPLATLCRGGPAQRARSLVQAVQLISHHGGQRASELLECTFVLATVHFLPTTMKQILLEAGMTAESIADQFAGTEFAQIFETRGEARGEAKGRVEGRVELLAEVLKEHFGADRDVVPAARRLAAWQDPAAALRAVAAAVTLDDLPDEPPAR